MRSPKRPRTVADLMWVGASALEPRASQAPPAPEVRPRPRTVADLGAVHLDPDFRDLVADRDEPVPLRLAL